MKRLPALLAALLLPGLPLPAAEVLIVADEFPAMHVLAAKLQAEEGIASHLVTQTNLPGDLKPFAAVVVYIHRNLEASAERAFIAYTEAGGRLIPLHHSISSGKRKNKQWFKFLGVELPETDVSAGGYKWIEPVTLDFVKLSDHFITTNKVSYPVTVPFTRPGDGTEQRLRGFTLHDSEVYLNHKLAGPRTRLLGLRYADAKTGQVWMQDHAGWLKPAGQGWIIYLMPGHGVKDFEEPAYNRLVLNAVICRL